ncbi:F-box/kelch-repeat protein At5g48990 [Arabidopsis lyrata subsp. lyrata]|uniref:F-box/kelch-repeat protein At5g48990 n=1 Tax=Arabidopsis lyrata subsp. lyrata TaxID=81972 RepID=UPI000A29CC07|nr:F-box/kelch-repeat protein At5g48990 [Arabidopsis lyrata subsp. lyrata]|eukprot:XP_020874991.1 F-box/kelch-repeat protein At5g48990 [Arabidopsis lyrata subsp. lyrata]
MSSTASAFTDGQPPWKKKKPSKDPTPNPSIPYDLIVSILARVSRSYYPKLSLVSKSFRSILASPELYQTRTLLGKTETFLYVCLRFPDEANPRWFTLYQKPNQTLTKKKKKKKKEESSVKLLAPTPVLNSPPLEWSSLIAVGSNLYAITAAIDDSPCSNVWYLDCRTHTWLEAPRMRLAHTNSKFDGTIYPPRRRIFKLENMEGKIYVNVCVESTKEVVLVTPKIMTWEALNLDLDRGSLCTIDNVVYLYNPSGVFLFRKSFIKEAVVWRILRGLERLPKFAKYSAVKLADYGGKLVVLWDKYVAASGYKEKMIWCAEISLEKRNNEEIWGKVEWFDAVLRVPKSYKILCATAATL